MKTLATSLPSTVSLSKAGKDSIKYKTKKKEEIATSPTVHLPGGVPKKGVNKANKDCFTIFSLKFRVQKLSFLAFPEGPGGFRELRKAGRNHFHLLTGPLG